MRPCGARGRAAVQGRIVRGRCRRRTWRRFGGCTRTEPWMGTPRRCEPCWIQRPSRPPSRVRPTASAMLACMQASASLTEADRSTQGLTADLTVLTKHLLMHTSSEFMATVERLGLSFTQVKALGVLRDAESPLTVKDLSDRLGLSLPAVSRAVESLVRRAEVKREEDRVGPPLQARDPHRARAAHLRPAGGRAEPPGCAASSRASTPPTATPSRKRYGRSSRGT